MRDADCCGARTRRVRAPHPHDTLVVAASTPVPPPLTPRRSPPGVERRPLVTTEEAYMLFRSGIKPATEFEAEPGRRATLNRRRAELAVRPKEFEM